VNMGRGAGVAIAALACMLASPAGSRKASGQTDPATGKGGETAGTKYALDSMDGVEVQSVKENGATDNNSKGQAVTYRGRRAVRIENIEGAMAAKISAGAQSIGILKSSDFKDGTIKLPACHVRERRRTCGGLSASPSACRSTGQSSSASICA
jgi:hypothetical protein